jgi:membrane protein YdbS with pleckstrin-like domain
MPDIFVNGQSDIVEEKPEAISTEEQITPSSPSDVLTNAEKHARIKTQHHAQKGHTHNVFASFFYYPEKVDFVNKDPQETVILMVRRHPITNLPWMILSFLFVIAPAFLSILTPFESLPQNYQIVVTIFWYMITLAFALEKFLSWFFNVNIVTDERIIDVDFIHLIYREITDADIEQIQDVTVEVGGTFRTILGYGDVLIQTASEMPKIRFEAIPHPDRVAKILRELRVEEQEEELQGRVR